MDEDAAPRQGLAESERAWFAEYYGEERFHPEGMRLRMERDLRLLLRERGAPRLGRVLSVGCGNGVFERMVARHADAVTGIDLSPVAIEHARRGAAAEGLENVAFEVRSAEEFTWREPFDVVLCMALLHHLPEAEERGFVARLFEHLAPGGFLFTLDPNAKALTRKLGRVVLGSRYHRYHTPDERELDPAAVEALLRDVGFAEVRYHGVDWALVPAMYLLASGPAWPLRVCERIDRILYATPLARWASGFSLAAHKAA